VDMCAECQGDLPALYDVADLDAAVARYPAARYRSGYGVLSTNPDQLDRRDRGSRRPRFWRRPAGPAQPKPAHVQRLPYSA